LKTDLSGALPVSYARQVPNAASLEEYVGYLTGQRPKPSGENAFQKSVFTKSLDWDYENEWRILDKETTPAAQLYVDRSFDPRELASIYFGCRMPQESKASIIDAADRLGTPISFFEMRDERIRFELTPVPMEI
jgi:hypothetical protein